MRTAAMISILIVTLAGCSGTQEFRVIDASNGRPIEGVHVLRASYSNDIFASARDEDVKLPDTNRNGIVVARGLDMFWMNHAFQFSKDGYHGAAAELQPRFPSSMLILTPSDGPPFGKRVGVTPLVTVRLYPRGKATSDPSTRAHD